MSDINKIRDEIQQYGMTWVRQQAGVPDLDPDDVTAPRIQECFGFIDHKTAKKWLREHGFVEDHDAIDRDNHNRIVRVWVRKGGP